MANIRKRVKKSSAKKPKTAEFENIKMMTPVQNRRRRTQAASSKQPEKAQNGYSAEKARTTAPQKKSAANKTKKSGSKNASLKKLYNLKVVPGSRSIFKKKKFILAFFCIVIAGIVVLLMFTTPTGLPEAVTNTFAAMAGGDGYPVKPDGSKILMTETSKGNIFALTDTDMVSYNKNGGSFFTVSHGFSNPSAAVSEARSLIYSYQEKKYIIANYKSVLAENEMSGNILFGNMSRSGHYVLVTKSTGYEAQAEVYDKNFNSVYKWFSADDSISAATLSPDGKRLALVTLGVQNGAFKSTVYCLTYDSANPIFKFELDEPVLELKTISSGCFAAVMNNGIIFYDWNNGEILKKDFPDDKVAIFKTDNKKESLAVCKNGIITDSYKIYGFNNGKEQFNFNFNGAVIDADICNGKVYILSNRQVLVLNSNGETEETYEMDSIASAINVADGGIIYANNDVTVFKIN